MSDQQAGIAPIVWQDGCLRLLDQRRLPQQEVYLECQSVAAVADAIREMVVRGAPAIAIAGAYGLVLAAQTKVTVPLPALRQALQTDLSCLAESRPTAVNLFAMLRDFEQLIYEPHADSQALVDELLSAAQNLHRRDLSINQRLAAIGAEFIQPDSVVYTHCNTGALACGGHGTALGIIRSAAQVGKISRVYAGETRPWLQGARLTVWELMREQIPVTLCVEGAAAHLMATKAIRWVIVGVDRVAANGDIANKIGTYNLAVLAKHHQVRFMAAAPTNSIDMNIASGREIPIEERDSKEVTCLAGQAIAPPGAEAVNPAFDVTPAHLIDVLVTERGAVWQPDRQKLMALLAD